MKLKKIISALIASTMALTAVSGLQVAVGAENDSETRFSLKLDGMEVDNLFCDEDETGQYFTRYNIDSLCHTYEMTFDANGRARLDFPKVEGGEYFFEISWDAPFSFHGSEVQYNEDDTFLRLRALVISDYSDNIYDNGRDPYSEKGTPLTYYVDSESAEGSFKYVSDCVYLEELVGSSICAYSQSSIIFDFETSGTIKFTVTKSDVPDESYTSAEEPKPEGTPASSESAAPEVTPPTVLTDGATNISVTGTLPDGTVLKTEEKAQDSTSAAYDITLTDKDGKAIQPTGTVTVKIPVPEALNGKDLKVFREESDGKYTNMNAKLENDVLSFDTDHFSVYVVTESDLDKTGDTAENTSKDEDKGEDEDKNVNTGFFMAVLPALTASGAVILFRRKK